MMKCSQRWKRTPQWLFIGVFLCSAVAASRGLGAEFGRVSGKVTDSGGNPLMGATVLLTGAGLEATGEIAGPLERVLTNARGNFTIDHVEPGWYSLQVISASQLPAFRNRVQVKPGETTKETFTLGDIVSSLPWQGHKADVHAWRDDWKWILRTSEATRPILRYRNASKARKQAAMRSPLPARRLVAVIPSSAGSEALGEDGGTGTLVAYLRPLDENSDVLIAGSVNRSEVDGLSFLADYRTHLLQKNNQEISLAVHQLSLQSGLPDSVPDRNGLANSQEMLLRFAQTRQLSSALTLTAGLEMRYLRSVQGEGVAHPEVKVAYRMNRSTILTLSYGTGDETQPDTLLERIGELNSAPRVTLRGFRPRLQDATRSELRLERKLGAASSIEIAAYHDAFHNVAVWGVGEVQDFQNEIGTGNVLFQSGGGRAILNAGRYSSSGAEGEYKRKVGHYAEVGILYAVGDALALGPDGRSSSGGVLDTESLPNLLHAEFTQSVSGKFSARVPGSETKFVTTYSWLPSGRVTPVDPYGLGRMGLTPYLNLQVQQPLPRFDNLPVHIVAVVDFRNLLGQGSVAVGRSYKPISLTSAYRAVRGGFSVQF